MTPDALDLGLRVFAGLALGALIGFERQWCARTAGVRTNALVALGASLVVILGSMSFAGPSDPTRVAAVHWEAVELVGRD